jgi:NADPH:quinone reductase-like Zn-dependent oxidoreductase
MPGHRNRSPKDPVLLGQRRGGVRTTVILVAGLNNEMKAAVCEAYGAPEVVSVKTVERPAIGDGDVLVRVHATTVNSGDARIRALRVPRGLALPMRLKLGWSKPRQPILGFEAVGEVHSIGSSVTRFEPGQRVVVSRGFDFGCHAEFVAVPENGAIASIPDQLEYQEAVALCFGGITSLNFFAIGKLGPGETLLINGASGSVGTMAVQLAKHMGAEVTAVCGTTNGELMNDLGADIVIDYTKQDFTQVGRRYDVIMDAHGNAPYQRIKDSLAPGGRFLMVVGDLRQTIAASTRKTAVTGSESGSPFVASRYETLMTLGGQGILRPVIDSVHPFDSIVDAHRRVDTSHKAGSVIVTF